MPCFPTFVFPFRSSKLDVLRLRAPIIIFSYLTLYSQSKTLSAFFGIFKTFQVITIKLRRFRLRKCYFGVLAVEYKQIGFIKTLTRFWTANFAKYENVIIGAIKCNTSKLKLRKANTKVGKQDVRSLYLFGITK